MKSIFIAITCILLSFINTSAQTSLVLYNINPGAYGTYPTDLTIVNNKLFFYALDLYGKTFSVSNNDTPVAEAQIGTVNVSLYWNTSSTVEVNGKYYYAKNSSIANFYTYDGVNPPVIAHKNIGNTESPQDARDLLVLNGKVYFSAHYLSGPGSDVLWKFDPNTKDLSFVRGITGAYLSAIKENLIFNNMLYVHADILYYYDPNTDTAKQVLQTFGLFGNSCMNVYNGKLYYRAIDTNNSNKPKVFEFDGTNNAKMISGSMQANVNAKGHPICGFKNKIYFVGYDAANNCQLCKYDPVANTVSAVSGINPSGAADPDWLMVYGSKLYFRATDGSHGTELWSYDGTNNPVMVSDINPGSGNADVHDLFVYNNSLYFGADNGTSGRELYKYTDSSVFVAPLSKAIKTIVYPNPSNGNFNFKIQLEKATKISISITDIYGREVYGTELTDYSSGENNINVDLNYIGEGNYFYSLTDNTGQTISKGKLQKL